MRKIILPLAILIFAVCARAQTAASAPAPAPVDKEYAQIIKEICPIASVKISSMIKAAEAYKSNPKVASFCAQALQMQGALDGIMAARDMTEFSSSYNSYIDAYNTIISMPAFTHASSINAGFAIVVSRSIAYQSDVINQFSAVVQSKNAEVEKHNIAVNNEKQLYYTETFKYATALKKALVNLQGAMNRKDLEDKLASFITGIDSAFKSENQAEATGQFYQITENLHGFIGSPDLQKWVQMDDTANKAYNVYVIRHNKAVDDLKAALGIKDSK